KEGGCSTHPTRLHPISVTRRRHAGHLFEGAAEMRLIGKAGFQRDIGKRCVAVAEARARELHAQPALLFRDAAMVDAAEDRRDARGRRADFSGDFLEGEVRSELVAENFGHAIDPWLANAFAVAVIGTRQSGEKLQYQTLNGQRRTCIAVTEFAV